MSEAPKQKPELTEHEDVNWLVKQIGWPHPTWIERDLYRRELAHSSDIQLAQNLIDMFNSLGSAIDKAMAGDNLAEDVTFKYWRKLSEKATKMKPVVLKATMYMHADYDKPWMLVRYA